MEKTWENVRDEIVKTYEIISITHNGRLITMADTENLFDKSWVYFKDYQSEQWVEVYSAMGDSIGIEEILKSQEDIHPEEGFEPLDEKLKEGFLNIAGADVHKIVARLENCNAGSLIFAQTCFQEAADQIEDEESEAGKEYILFIFVLSDLREEQYYNLTSYLKNSDIADNCGIVVKSYAADLTEEQYGHWVDDRLKEGDISEEEYINFCRKNGLSGEIYPPNLTAARLFYCTKQPRLMAYLILKNDEQVARIIFPKIVEFAYNNGLLIYDQQIKEKIDLNDPGQLPPGWTNYWESLKKPK
jgi:hypothetical protein